MVTSAKSDRGTAIKFLGMLVERAKQHSEVRPMATTSDLVRSEAYRAAAASLGKHVQLTELKIGIVPLALT